MFVIAPKETGNFRGIQLVEVLWNTILGVINRQIGVAVQFHNILHGLWGGQGIGTEFIEDKILQQLTAMREEVLYEVLLYL